MDEQSLPYCEISLFNEPSTISIGRLDPYGTAKANFKDFLRDDNGELDNCHKPPGAGKPCRVLRVCITMGLTIMSVFTLVVIILALLTLKGYLSPSQVVV
ncbi:hypothetical protein J7T55_006809 [Diaporthe amygdali]|uniref:uncharacterized protein n=1 Tax=Phomopsis amygdali TaxID=1214568 RepID=UPI0022FF1D62|nr:uncharacterized protein J7T55_006809 [Diaporthe amygdali]KAJ0125463.1 hypothetical protein J7T55_006809 [Diaporthe amygdali]